MQLSFRHDNRFSFSPRRLDSNGPFANLSDNAGYNHVSRYAGVVLLRQVDLPSGSSELKRG